MGFKNKLKEHLKGNLSKEDLSLLPRGFQTLGKTIILKLKILWHEIILWIYMHLNLYKHIQQNRMIIFVNFMLKVCMNLC